MKKTLREKLRSNPWMAGTFVLGFAVLFLIGQGFFETNKEINDSTSLETLCGKITGTPAWFNWRGEPMGVGVIEVMEDTIKRLIDEKVYFVYNSNCGWCKKQIEDFGDNWEEYKESGFTKDCAELNKITGGKK